MQSIVDDVKRSLARQREPMAWRRVTVPGLDTPWVGLHVPVIDTGGRPWVWEVVTPEVYDASSTARHDPLVLRVHQDAVITEIHHRDTGGPVVRMQSPVSVTPSDLRLVPGPDPDGPWNVSLSTGWTVQALAAAAQNWIDRESPGSPSLTVPRPPRRAPDHYQLHPAIRIEAEAFDHLLTLDADEAADVTSLLVMVHDALVPYR